MQRELNAQFEQTYGTGRMGGYSGSLFGGSNESATGDFGGSSDYRTLSGSGGNTGYYVSVSGYGGGFRNPGVHTDRSVPKYSTRSFGDDYGAGTGRIYGGKNYGAAGYPDGNRDGSLGNNTYGSSSGNCVGHGSMGGGAYGSGGYGSSDPSNYGRLAAYADRGSYRRSDPHWDFDF